MKPQVIWFNITFRCNMNCLHCAVKNVLNKVPEASLDQIIKFFKKEFLKGVTVKITGGEPLLRKDLPEILAFIADSGAYSIDIETNAYLITENIVNKIINSIGDTHVSFAISIDGFEQDHDYIRGVKGSFKKAINAIRMLKEYGIEITVITVVNNLNISYLLELANFIINKLEVDNHRILIPLNLGGAKQLGLNLMDKIKCINTIIAIIEHFHRYVSTNVPPSMLPKKYIGTIGLHDCGWGEFMLSINPDLTISFCPRLYEPLLKDTLLDKHIIEVLNTNVLVRLRILRRNKRLFWGVCSKCKLFELCRGGCRAEAYCTYGDYNAPFPLCQNLYELGLFPTEMLE